MSTVPVLPECHRFVVNYAVVDASGLVGAQIARIFVKPQCTWADIVDEWFDSHSPTLSAERYVLIVNDKVIGWHFPLSAVVQTDALIIDVVAKPLQAGEATHLPIGIPYRLSLSGQRWPAWRSTDTCPINQQLLGGDLPSLSPLRQSAEDMLREHDNHPSNLMGLRFLDENGVIWVNKYALMNSLHQMEAQSRLQPEVDVFLSRVCAAMTARSLTPAQIDKSFPVVFDPELRLPLPVIVFDRHLTWLDLGYSGALTGGQ